MSYSLYIHIPFCKLRCDYCNFYSQTKNKDFEKYINAVITEAKLQQNFLPSKNISTVYLGGGTPSIIPSELIIKLLENIKDIFNIVNNAEVTIEVNPDDINRNYIETLSNNSIINRVSIGIQSFQDKELQAINRRHSATQARTALETISENFKNYSLDLIYGLPFQNKNTFKENIEISLAHKPKHISAYALSVEAGTRLERRIKMKQLSIEDDEFTVDCYNTLNARLANYGFEHYEISNYSLTGFRSKHNSAYWHNIEYLGLGAGAHSYNGYLRQFNISNIDKYYIGIHNNTYFDYETLDDNMRYNEYIMLGLRTSDGINLDYIEHFFGKEYNTSALKSSEKIKKEHLIIKGNTLSLTEKGMLFADYYASLFFVM